MTRRGPRGDLGRERILRAADALLLEHGEVAAVSLRMVADRLGVTANALYTYFPSLARIMHDLADERLDRLRPAELLDAGGCKHCALIDLFHRAQELYASAGTLALLKAQPVLGPASFRLSETVMALCSGGNLHPRDSRDLIMGWFCGSASLSAEGWATGTDALRAAQWRSDEFPRISGRPDPNPQAQFDAILRGLGIDHTPDIPSVRRVADTEEGRRPDPPAPRTPIPRASDPPAAGR